MKCWYRGKCNKETIDCDSPYKSCLRYQNMLTLVRHSRLPESLRYPVILTPEAIDYESFTLLSEARSQILDIVKKGQSIYLWSKTPGNGKTTWACKLLLAYFNEVWMLSQLRVRGLFIYTPTLLNNFKSQFINGVSQDTTCKEIKECDLLVLDDLGCGRLSDYDINNLLDLIDYRLSNNKSIIFTSNLDMESLKRLFGERLTSRIYNSSLVIELKGSDRRGIKL